MTIHLEVKQHYGATHIYVTGEAGRHLRTLTGRKTVTSDDLDALRALGHTVEIPEAFAIQVPVIEVFGMAIG